MNSFKLFLIFIGVNFCLISCMTPIQDRALLKQLTTCKHGDLERVKQNLMLMGYDIATYDDKSLSTYFKQDTTGYSKKLYTKVNVVKLKPKLIRFKVREKMINKVLETDSTHVSTSSSTTGVSSTGIHGVAHNQGSANIYSYRSGTNKDEYDFVYYQEKEAEYRYFRDQICEIDK